MKRFFTNALILALAIGSAHAQTTSSDKNKGNSKEYKARKAGHDKMYDQLNLSAEQKTKLQALREDYKKQLHELNNNTTLSKEQKLARRKELHLQHKDQVSAILTPAQREQAGKMKADWKSKDKGARKGDAAGRARKGAMQQELNLTQDQQTKMQQIRTDYRSKFAALRNDKALTQEQKKVKMQELMQAQQAQMKSILTKEQAEKLEAQRNEFMNRNTK
jgi:Spy/CpxP family protein refolding chaperone